MLYTFRFEGKKYAYDSASGAIMQPTALEFKMLGAIQPPLTRACPTSLRYELAKFDSLDVEETYDGIYALFEKKVLYVEDTGCIRVMTEGEYAFPSAGLMSAALEGVFSKAEGDIRFEATGKDAVTARKIASEVAARFGKTLFDCDI